MIARIVTIVLSVAVTLAVPAILAVNGVRLVTNERYVEAVYEHGGVPDDRYGLSSATRERLALVGLESIQPSRRASRCCARRGCQVARRRSTLASCRTWKTSARPSRAHTTIS